MVFITRIHPPPPLLAVTHPRQLWPMVSPTISPSPTLPLPMHANNPRWDSNAETFRTRNFHFHSNHDFQQQEEEDDDDDSNQWLDILDNFIDGVWIFKVFRSFGWMLPAIISSFLLTSGPQAFLMALAIPMGQSALSLLFQTLWGTPKTKTRRRGKSERKQPPPPPRPPPRGASYVDLDDEQEEYVESERKREAGYQTSVAGDESSENTTSGSSSSFGGWEELDGRRTRSNKDGNRKQSKGKMSTRLKRSETPLLLRLLIAVFPFLGSWTKLL